MKKKDVTRVFDNYSFVNNFSILLLCKINILDIFNMVDFFRFLLDRVLIKLNFWLRMYVSYIESLNIPDGKNIVLNVLDALDI